MKQMKKTGSAGRFGAPLAILFFLAVSAPLMYADGIISVNAEADATRVGILDTLTLTVTVNAENTARIPAPQLPDFTFFTVVNESTSSQTSISIINGKATRTKTITHAYTLKPVNKGSFTIDPVSIQYRGETYRTDPISVTVVDGHAKSEGGTLSPDEQLQVDLEKLKKDVFILVKPDTSTVYEGQQLMLTYTLYSRLDIDSISLKESPEYPGFYKEEIFNATRLEYRKETYENRSYNTTLLKKVVLFPINPGSYEPKPLTLEMTVYLKGEDLFSFFGRPYTFAVTSNDLSITVQPLPRAATGGKFTHVVGSMEANLSKNENTANTGEATTCYLTLKSTGNLNIMSDPGIQLSKRGRVYLSETMTDKVEEEHSVYFIKKFEYTVIPEESGSLEITAGDFLYFDVNQKSYANVTPEPMAIRVIGRDIFQEKPIIGAKSGYAEGGFHFIKGDVKELRSRSFNFFTGSAFYFYHLALLSIVGGLFFVRLKREKLEKNQNLFRMKKARSFAQEWFKKANDALSAGRIDESVDHLYRALATYIAYKCGKNLQDITYRNVCSILEGCMNVPESMKARITRTLEQCTLLKYARGAADETGSVRELHETVPRIIQELESLGHAPPHASGAANQPDRGTPRGAGFGNDSENNTGRVS
jgi:hypothetical protein